MSNISIIQCPYRPIERKRSSPPDFHLYRAVNYESIINQMNMIVNRRCAAAFSSYLKSCTAKVKIQIISLGLVLWNI